MPTLPSNPSPNQPPTLPTQVKDAEEKGATFCTGPYRREANLIWPVVLDHVTPEMRIAWEEVRGHPLRLYGRERAGSAQCDSAGAGSPTLTHTHTHTAAALMCTLRGRGMCGAFCRGVLLARRPRCAGAPGPACHGPGEHSVLAKRAAWAAPGTVCASDAQAVTRCVIPSPPCTPLHLQPFGPVLPIVRVKSVEQAIEHVNANRLALQVMPLRLCICLPCPCCCEGPACRGSANRACMGVTWWTW